MLPAIQSPSTVLPNLSNELGYQHTGQQRIFLRRMNHIKEKIEKDLELIRISRSDPNRGAPRGGLQIIKEEKLRKLNESSALDQLRLNPSVQFINELSQSS